MTSDARRFPIGLTLAAILGIAICSGLGVWQLQRAAWKAQMLADITARRAAAPQPIGPVLARAAAGADVAFTRVVADCLPAPPGPAQLRETIDNGQWIARALGVCRPSGGPYGAVIVDRGLLTATREETNPAPVTLPAPAHVEGLLLPKPQAFPRAMLSGRSRKSPA